MYLTGSEYLQTLNVSGKENVDGINNLSGEIIINAAPGNEWVPIGTNAPYLSKPHNPTDLRDFKLRCIVTDATNTSKTSNEYYVEVVSYPPEFSFVTKESSKSIPKAAIIADKSSERSTVLSLNQNYPNPFNPETIIGYSLPQTSSVTLKVYDILGREIITLVNEFKPAGKYFARFNGSEFPSGLYIYHLAAGDLTLQRKMLLVK